MIKGTNTLNIYLSKKSKVEHLSKKNKVTKQEHLRFKEEKKSKNKKSEI